MKIKLKFEINNNKIPIHFHEFIISFIKKSLMEYDENLYKKLYNQEEPITKTFTFAIYFKNPVFLGDVITVESKNFELNLSDYSLENGLHFYNAFKQQLNKPFKIQNNEIKLINVFATLQKEIKETSIIIKMLSPLIVREHKSDNKDSYYFAEDKEFCEKLKENINNVISGLKLNISTEDFEIIPLKPEKTVVKIYNTSINASIGIFQLKGNSKLIDFLSKAGIGAMRSSGFGYFKIIG